MKVLFTAFYILPLLAISQYKTDSAFIKHISDEVLLHGKAYENLRQLTKKIGGRLAGSPQFAKAVQWGKETMQASSADTVFLQQCMVPHWVRGGTDKAFIVSANGKKENRPLHVLALGNSLGTGKNGVTAQVLAVSSFDELEKRKDEVKDKIVFYNARFNSTNLDASTSYGETGFYRYQGASRAAKYGAKAVLIRSLTEAADNNPHTGSMRYNDSFPKIAAAATGLQDADYLWELCKSGKPVTVSIITHGYFLPDTIGHNVIAEIKGTGFKDEYITVGGHLDSWDVNEGAHDDGAGIVQTIEVMRVLKALGYKPKHTLRFVLFANEENGLRGGTAYAEQAKLKNEKHLFALESDEGGFSPRGFGFTIADERLQKIQPWKNLLLPYGVYELKPGFGGSDIDPLNKMLGTTVAGLIPDEHRYFDVHHSRADVFEAVNRRELNFGAINMAALIYLVDRYGL
jgi:carboxypeptidase Q